MASFVVAIFTIAFSCSEVLADQQLVFTYKSHVERTAKTATERKAQESNSKTIENKNADLKDKAQGEEKPIIENKESVQTITLGNNYFIVETGTSKTVYDFARKQMYALNPKDKTYSAFDIHALVYFRVMEFQNRVMLGGLLESAGATEVGMGNRFELESLFGIDDPRVEKKTVVQEHKDGETIQYSFEGKKCASYVPSTENISPEYKRTYLRMLSHLLQIHPSIRASLVGKNIPQELKYDYKDMGEAISVEYKLQATKTVPDAAQLLPQDYKASSGDKDLDALVETVAKLGDSPKRLDMASASAQINAAASKKTISKRSLFVLNIHSLKAMIWAWKCASFVQQ